MYSHHDVGLADNGDFTRYMGWISSGPIGIEPNWPDIGSKDWSRRFFNYWIPFWKFRWNIAMPAKSSAFLLWLPGAVLNKFLYSNKVLYLPYLSILPKLILFFVLLLIFKWINLNARHKTILLISIGIPITLMFTTTDYVAYLNSFYAESAGLIFYFLLLISIVILKRFQSFTHLLCSLASVMFLATAKPAYLYWPLLAIPFIFYAWSLNKGIKLHLSMLVIYSALITLFILASAFITNAGSTKINPYNSLFNGALTFSNNPSAHLRNLGIDNALQCINTSAFSSIGQVCFAKYQNQMSFINTARVLYREPLVIFRLMKYALDRMQDISLEYLGKYSFYDPRSKRSLRVSSSDKSHFWLHFNEGILLRLWSEFKFRFFPKGYALIFVIIGFLTWFILGLKRTSFQQDLAFIGLISIIACIIDMNIAILGDGKTELIKHLFLSNVLFDIAAIAFFNSTLLYCLDFIETKLKSIISKLKAA